MATPDVPRTTIAPPTGAFRQAGWAFLFLGVTIGPTVRLGQEAFLIDLLPDFVGYLMIALAANRLIPLHHGARIVRNLAMVLTFLTIPTVVQYTVTASQAGAVTIWNTPLWPLTVAVGLLDLVLVWLLCGLVADLARGAGDEATRRQAVARRLAYVVLRVALFVSPALLVPAAPKPELIMAVAVALVAVGLLLFTLMMGLLWRAEWLCRDWSEGPEPPSDIAAPGGRGFRLLVLAAIALPLVLGALAFRYYLDWRQARDEARQRTSNSEAFGPARDAFYADLLAGRIDEAYESTTADFKTRISRGELADLAREYVAYVNRAKAGDRGGGAGTSSGDDALTQYEYTEVEPGKVVRVTITIRRDRDSILFREPPPLRVDDFRVEEGVAPPRPGLPFGGPRPGR